MIALMIISRIHICNTLLAKSFADVTMINQNASNKNVGNEPTMTNIAAMIGI